MQIVHVTGEFPLEGSKKEMGSAIMNGLSDCNDTIRNIYMIFTVICWHMVLYLGLKFCYSFNTFLHNL